LVQGGSFQLTTCTGPNDLNAYCFSGGQAGTGFLYNVNVSPGLSTFGIVCEDCYPLGGQGDGVTDIDGNFYPTVINGNQEWMAENLRVTHFSNGDAIPEVTDNAAWNAVGSPAWCYLENNAANNVVFGKLYNAYVVEDARQVCPTGWHVPTNEEWATFVDFLGGSNEAGTALRTTGTINEGTGFWPFDNVQSTNSSGFSAQPSRFRGDDGAFPTQIYSANWWTRTAAGTETLYTRSIYSFSNMVFNQDLNRPYGISIRCLRD